MADVFARYWRGRLGADNVFFLTGTDEHGQKIAEAAEKAGKQPQEFVDEVSQQFKDAWSTLNISHDYFFRTTDAQHKKIVQDILQALYDRGLIYKDIYRGLYCVGCERYLQSDDIVDGHCPLHPNGTLEDREEENYFLRLTQLAPHVLEALERDEYRVLPVEKKNEIVSKVRGGIKDVSISRAGVSWGIPIPWDTQHTVYVWIDALFNYFTATRIVPGKEQFWPADIHILAKDILWFHAFIWEALLMASELPLPKVVFAHGFFTIDGQKMSKSLGNAVDPKTLVEKYGVDGARYLLLSAFPFGNDGDISLSRFDEKFNADLANGIGNLVSRVATLCEKAQLTGLPEPEVDTVSSDAFDRFQPDEELARIWNDIRTLDKKINDDAPWKLEGAQLKTVIAVYAKALLRIGVALKPFLPETGDRVVEIFTKPAVTKPHPLFSRV